jgi:hypothetical protein
MARCFASVADRTTLLREAATQAYATWTTVTLLEQDQGDTMSLSGLLEHQGGR